MDHNLKSGRSDDIRGLIRLEKEEAERGFESCQFDARLFKRIREATEEKPVPWLSLLRKPAPVLALLLLLLALAGFLLFRERPESPFRRTVWTISTVLAEAGDSRKLNGRADANQLLRNAEYTDFGWAVKGVFYACERRALGDINLADCLSLIFQKNAPQARSAGERKDLSAVGEERPRLRTDEEFRKFFIVFLKKLEEV